MKPSRKHASSRAAATGMALSVIAMLFGVAGCNEYGIPAGTSPHREFNFLDMSNQPKMKPQRGDLLGGPDFMTPAGAIPRGYHPYRYEDQPEVAGQKLRNPLPSGKPEHVERGKLMFERYCLPCHGTEGAGDGLVIEKGYPAPPSLLTQKLRDWPDGRVFHVVTAGQNIMPSYATQIVPRDRWAAVLYVRDMQSRLPVAPPAENEAPAREPSPADSAAPAGSAAPPDSAAAPPDGASSPARGAPPTSAAPPPPPVSGSTPVEDEVQ